MKTVMVFEFVNDTRVIGKVDDDFEMLNNFEIYEPLSIFIEPKQTGLSVQLVPWIPFADGVTKFSKSAVICFYQPKDGLEKEYKSQTSGIILGS